MQTRNRETWLFLNEELCEFVCSFPIVKEPKKDFQTQARLNPIDWVRTCIYPDNACEVMTESIGRLQKCKA